MSISATSAKQHHASKKTLDPRINTHKAKLKEAMKSAAVNPLGVETGLTMRQYRSVNRDLYGILKKVEDRSDKPVSSDRPLAVFLNSKKAEKDSRSWMKDDDSDESAMRLGIHNCSMFYKGVKNMPLRVYDGTEVKMKKIKKIQIKYLTRMALMEEEFECVSIFCKGFKDGMKKAGSLAKLLKRKISVIKVSMHGASNSIGVDHPYSSTDLKSLHDDINDETMKEDGVFDLTDVCLTGRLQGSTCFAKELARSMLGRKVFACKTEVTDENNNINSLNPYEPKSINHREKDITVTFHDERPFETNMKQKPVIIEDFFADRSSDEEKSIETFTSSAVTSPLTALDAASAFVRKLLPLLGTV